LHAHRSAVDSAPRAACKIAQTGGGARCRTDRELHSHGASSWECTRVSDGRFECVLLDAPALARARPDPSAFAADLAAPVNTFDSLGGDATLIAPSATGEYGHFAAGGGPRRRGALL